MDPNATLKYIDEFIGNSAYDFKINETVEDLLDWLRKGGFAPDWSKYPDAAAYVRARLCTLKELAKVTLNF